jgi:hypothetical protein
MDMSLMKEEGSYTTFGRGTLLSGVTSTGERAFCNSRHFSVVQLLIVLADSMLATIRAGTASYL